MINGNSYQALTHNGISQLFSDTFERQEFILQVIQVFPPRDQSFVIFFSDGFTWIKGELVDQAKADAMKISLTSHTVVKFLAEDIETNSASWSFKLRKFQVVSSKIVNVIGEPVPYNDFQKKKSFINFESGNMISNKRYISLREVKQMPAGKISATILAKIVKKPDKINTVMNIRIEDEQKEEIQCCFFGDQVNKYRDILNWGEWYYFEDPVLQINNKFGNMLELKINNQSKVIKEKKSSEVKPGIINHNNAYKPKPEFEKKTKENVPLKEFVLKDYQGKEGVEEYDTYVIARPLKLFTMKNNVGRSFECVNQHGEIIEILLWNDCSAEVKLGQTYRFDYMKVKAYRQKISLHSQRGKTQLSPAPINILSRDEYYGNKKVGQGKAPHQTKQRFLGSNQIVYSIAQMIEKSEKSNDKKIFVMCCGYLTIKFDNSNSNSFDGYNDLRKKVFYVNCQKCENNEYLRSKIELESMNGKVVCNSCKSETVGIMWNIKAIFMDSNTEIPCKINSQIAEKLLEMTPSQGMLLFLSNSQQLKHKIQKKLNFKRGVFKFSSKSNEKKEGDRFYNIWEYYEDGNKIFVQRSMNELKRTYSAFMKLRNKSSNETFGLRQEQQDLEMKDKGMRRNVQEQMKRNKRLTE